MDKEILMAAFVLAQVVLVPILGALWFGIREERQQLRRLLIMAIQASSRRIR